MIGRFALAGALLVVGCSTPAPPPRTVAMEALPPPPPPARRKVALKMGETSAVVGEALVARAEDPSIVRVISQGGSLALVPHKVGKTVLHVTAKDGETEDVDVEIEAGDPFSHVLGVGDTFVIPTRGVKEYSVGLPDVVVTAMTSDGLNLVVSGRKPGRTTIVLFETSGAQRAHTIVVFGGKS